ncbi:MAG: T9SS type A sorting domain-containing protein, partial [Paludibacteraceae bacterium]|nr:T9SS type A sorting domain-containing protein [Paludibacteraceae bacterium]
IAGHDYIDLGLPSGTLWATYNIGATKPEEYGDYFAWGETEPKDVYNWDTYKYAKVNEDGKFDSITKYNMSEKYGIIDSLSTLLPEDDAATANWGKEWRMPTNEEQRELYENSYMVWTDGYNGTDVRGVIFYKAKSAEDKGKFVPRWETPSSDYSVSDDAHVFLPNDRNYYWSSSLNEDDEVYALYLYIITKGVGWDGRFRERVSGYPVRAVANKVTPDNPTNTSNIISNPALQVYADNGSIHVANAQPNTKIQVFDMNGKTVASGATDAEGSAEIRLSVLKGVYVVSDGNQSTKVVVE